jgi:paraquat-inducible protein B
MSGEARPEPTRTQAAVRRSRWPGWIWAVPIAALLVVGWLGFRALTSGGADVTITFDDVHGLKQGDTSVLYRGMKVGKVKEVKLAKDGSAVDVTVHVDDSVTAFLRSETQFWLRGAEPSLSDPSSLTAIVSGPTIMMDPGPGEPTKQFVGLTQKPVVSATREQPKLYAVRLQGSVGELKKGAPVKLRGFTVGEVTEIGFRYDPSSGELATPVTLALYPSLLQLDGGAASQGDRALAAAIDRLIGEGLQARLERDPPVVGTAQVTLEIMPGSSGAKPSVVDGMPQIPAAAGGGLNSIVERVNKVPIEQIAKNVLDVSHHVDQIVASPELGDAIAQLDATLQQVHQTADSAGPKITDLVDRLRKTAGQIDGAAKAAESAAKTAQNTAQAADRVVGGTPGQNDMQKAMREIVDAARSVRDLAEYLDRHPEALIQGRSGE